MLKLLKSLFSRKPVILSMQEETTQFSKGEQLCMYYRNAENIH